jgi:hypothetical protein
MTTTQIGTTTIHEDIQSTRINSKGQLVATVYQFNADRGYGRYVDDCSSLCRMNDNGIIQLRKNLAIQELKKAKKTK